MLLFLFADSSAEKENKTNRTMKHMNEEKKGVNGNL